MQALILAGGEGTRLRPLTTTVPKPVVPLVDRPFIAFMLDWLRTHGVDDIVISCGHMASGVRNVLGDGSAFGVKLRYVEEPTPLGTGGALKYAESLLDDRFLMLNGDVLTDIDLSAQLAQHERTGATATLALTPVDDPTNYGLVRQADDGAVTEFVEKPSYDQIDTRNISAGAYVLERSVLDLLAADQPASIERDVFPQLVGSGLYGCVSENYWLDIGTPERYLEATFDILEGTVGTAFAERAGDGYLVVEQSVESEGRIIPSALVESGCRIADGARVGGRVVLESGVTVGANTTLERAVVMRGAEIGANCTLSECIVGGGVRIGDNTHVTGLSVLGEGVTIGADNVIANGARIFPGVELPDGAISSDGASLDRAAWPQSTRRARRRTSSVCPTTWRTRCGASRRRRCSPPARPAGSCSPAWAARASAARWRARRCGRSCARPLGSRAGRAAGAGPGRRRSCCARATRARTEETLAAYDAAGEAGAPRVVCPSGGELAARARRDKVPVIPLPGGFQPRAAVGYSFVVALEVAARGRLRAVAAHRDRGGGAVRPRARRASGGPTATRTATPSGSLAHCTRRSR